MHPVLQQVQWYTESETKLFVKPKFFEAEKVFPNVFGKITANKLLAAISEGTSAIRTRVVHSWTEKFSVV
jgi:hypothetical protein